MESFDGGQPQYFLLEVVDVQTGELQANVTSKFPAFRVTGLHAGRVLRMQVYAANIKGRSDYVLLDGSTLEIAEKQTGRLAQYSIIIFKKKKKKIDCFVYRKNK